jgi:hypothetical protein
MTATPGRDIERGSAGPVTTRASLVTPATEEVWEPLVERRAGKLVIEVPRLPTRADLPRCRARAKVVAARLGVRSEPDVLPYNRSIWRRGPMQDPQGWIFTFGSEDEMTRFRAPPHRRADRG